MLTFYIISAIVGGGLILVSALGGFTSGVLDGVDTDHDVDLDSGDMDHDVSAGHHLEYVKDAVATSDFWLPFFSLRFWIYFFACFGLIGTIATLLNFGSSVAIGLTAGITGLLMGTAVAWAMRFLSRNNFDSSIKEEDFIGVAGRMVIVPRNGEPGKIRMSIKGDTIDMLALPQEGVEFEKGEEVVVVGFRGTKVEVARFSDIVKDE